VAAIGWWNPDGKGYRAVPPKYKDFAAKMQARYMWHLLMVLVITVAIVLGLYFIPEM
jgi:hypothetical protein